MEIQIIILNGIFLILKRGLGKINPILFVPTAINLDMIYLGAGN
jgi:hypothetical protein